MIWFLLCVTMQHTTPLSHRLQAVVDSFLAENPQAPGMVVHLIDPRHGLDRSFVSGFASMEKTQPLTSDHCFRLASNTKTYVAAAVLKKVEQGAWRLDDSIEHLLRDVELIGWLKQDGYDVSRMTLVQLLSHTSGLNEHTSDERFFTKLLTDPQHQWHPKEQVKACMDWCDPVGAPGERHAYSDTGYVLLGLLLTQETPGVTLGQTVRQLLDFETLGLTQTYWEQMEPTPAGEMRAHQYIHDLDTTDWNPSFDLFGGGGLISTARDMAWFLRQLMQGKVFAEKATLATMKEAGSHGYRLGLIRFDFQPHEGFGHLGFWNTFAVHFPDADLTVAGSLFHHDAQRGSQLVPPLLELLREP
jgi:D-alanyl-D-alanine carboxypeptidase